MTTSWKATDLSVTPPSWQMASGDRETFAFDAQEAVTTATATLRALTDGAGAGTLEGPTLTGNIARVTVSVLTRGAVYELAVTFTNAAGRRWTKTLILPVVA